MKTQEIARVRQMRTRGGNPAPNQFIIEQENYTIFQSYDSTIAIIEYGEKPKITFFEDWNYSVTTSKYLYDFLSSRYIILRGRKEVEDAIEKGEFTTRNTTWIVEYSEEL